MLGKPESLLLFYLTFKKYSFTNGGTIQEKSQKLEIIKIHTYKKINEFDIYFWIF